MRFADGVEARDPRGRRTDRESVLPFGRRTTTKQKVSKSVVD
jgi:hypothetical protein